MQARNLQYKIPGLITYISRQRLIASYLTESSNADEGLV